MHAGGTRYRGQHRLRSFAGPLRTRRTNSLKARPSNKAKRMVLQPRTSNGNRRRNKSWISFLLIRTKQDNLWYNVTRLGYTPWHIVTRTWTNPFSKVFPFLPCSSAEFVRYKPKNVIYAAIYFPKDVDALRIINLTLICWPRHSNAKHDQNLYLCPYIKVVRPSIANKSWLREKERAYWVETKKKFSTSGGATREIHQGFKE
jgi:hypothetical protein